jgi:hypothetical protein
MRVTFILLPLLIPAATASWWSSEKPEYQSWSTKQLEAWLKEHNIAPPKGFSQEQLRDIVKANWNQGVGWTQEQFHAAQQVFSNIKDDSFEAWDESKLRQFLLDRGIVAPKGPKEHLVQTAKSLYSDYTSAVSSYSSRASNAASTAIHGDTYWQASKSASSVAAQATQSVMRKLDDTKDYVYSTWDDNKLRSYLEEKGVITSRQTTTRQQLLAYMHDAYASVTDPIWDAWSDSYMHEWLVHHGIVKSDFQKNRDALRKKMQQYYYNADQYVWDTWTDSQLHDWLVKHNIIKSNAKLSTEKMKKLVQDNYNAAADSIYAGWHDSEMRTWLIEHGYMRSDAQVKRDELIKLFNDKYHDASARTKAFITWPDTRLRVFLRQHGLTEEQLPATRDELLHEVRARYYETSSGAEALLAKIRAKLSSGVEICEDKLHDILSVLGGATDEAKVQTRKAQMAAANSAASAAASASSMAESLSSEAAKASKKAEL